MTEPTIDERIEGLVTAWRFGNGPGYLEAIAIIVVLRKRIAELEAQIVSIEAENHEWVSKLEAEKELLDKFATSMWESHNCADAKCETCRLYTEFWLTSHD